MLDSGSSSSTRIAQVFLTENNSDEEVKVGFTGQVLLTRKCWGNKSNNPPWTLSFQTLFNTPLVVIVEHEVTVPPHTRFRYLANVPRNTSFEMWADLDEFPTTIYRRDRIWEYQPSYTEEFTDL